MPTTKLGLPLITENMTNDVPRDLNALAEKIDSKSGEANGLATLGADGKVPSSQINLDTSTLATKEELATHLAEDASTSKKGHVQLSDATDNTSSTLAATANAVKKAWDLANGKYSKPASGIPKTDLNAAVQATLNKVDSGGTGELIASITVPSDIALVEIPNISNYRYIKVVMEVFGTNDTAVNLLLRFNGDATLSYTNTSATLANAIYLQLVGSAVNEGGLSIAELTIGNNSVGRWKMLNITQGLSGGFNPMTLQSAKWTNKVDLINKISLSASLGLIKAGSRIIITGHN